MILTLTKDIFRDALAIGVPATISFIHHHLSHLDGFIKLANHNNYTFVLEKKL